MGRGYEQMIARLIGGFVAILIGVSVIPMITKAVNLASENVTNASAWGATTLRLVPGFFTLAVLGIGVAIAWSAFRSAGMLGGRDIEEPTEEEIEEARKEYYPEPIVTPKKQNNYKEPIITKEYKRVYTDEGGKFD